MKVKVSVVAGRALEVGWSVLIELKPLEERGRSESGVWKKSSRVMPCHNVMMLEER